MTDVHLCEQLAYGESGTAGSRTSNFRIAVMSTISSQPGHTASELSNPVKSENFVGNGRGSRIFEFLNLRVTG